jgi:predicted HTH domain antitoxin
LTKRRRLIEVACRLFQAGRLSLPKAGNMAGLARVQMEEELHRRSIPAYTYTDEMLDQDLETIEFMKGSNSGSGRQ